MSMNIHMKAELQGEFRSNNGKVKFNKTIVERFDCLQTPTVVTKDILKSDDKTKTYTDWVISNFDEVSKEPVYAENDIFNDKPIAYKDYNPGQVHIKKLNEFLETYKDWNIIWYEM